MTQSRPTITRTTHTLPFDRLSPQDFERLCLALLPREGFENPLHYGGEAGGEQGRDIVTRRDGELWYVQCKRVKRCGPKVLLDEIEKIRGLMERDLGLHPAGVLFIVSCNVSATARDRASKRCVELGLVCEVWAHTDLDTRLQPHRDIIQRFFSQWVLATGVPFHAPPLPPHFVPRPEVSDVLKARLLANEAAVPGVLVVSAIYGLGGIGKSTVAAALTYDEEVQERFSDGILWATLGQQPDLLSLLSAWVQALGDYDFHPTTVETASIHLRTLLQDKAALLMVDDVWDPDHARPFLSGGHRCQVLITTRRADVADEVGADLYQLDVMTPGQSLELLSARLGRALEGAELEETLLLAKAVGYLPLALELAAARMARGTPWAALRGALEEEVARLEALEEPRRRRKGHVRLEASFDLSLNALRADDEEAWRAFIWLGVLPEDVVVQAQMAATLWEMGQGEASEMLELLWNDALLLSGPRIQIGELALPTYRLHDLLHDMARRLLTADQPQGLGLTLPQAHARLLERYRARTQAGLWHTLPDDSYILAHLAWHMEQAEWVAELHALLREETAEGWNGWYEARERLGQRAGYLEDVARAWRQAEIMEDVGMQVRYALCRSSVAALSANVPVELLARAVEYDFLSPAQALTITRGKPEEKERAGALIALAPVLAACRPALLREALASARTIGDREVRAEALVGLALHLPAVLGKHVLAEALAAAREIGDGEARAEALAELAPHLPEVLSEQVLREAWAVVREIQAGEARARALAELAPHLPEELLGEALAEVRELPKGDLDAYSDFGRREFTIIRFFSIYRLKTLTRLASRLPLSLFREALVAAREIEDKGARAWTLMGMGMVPHLPEELREQVLREALTTAWEIGDGKARVEALAGLIPHLPRALREQVLEEALTVAREIKEERAQAQMLVELVPYLPKALREQALEDTLVAARDIVDEEALAWTLTELAPHLPVLFLRKALAVAREIADEGARAKALKELAPYLPEPLLREALAGAQQIGNERGRAEALTGLVPYLPELLSERVLKETLAAAWEIGDGEARAEALAGLCPHLRASLLQEALAAAREIGDKGVRAWALTGLVPYLPETLREQVLQEVLVTAREVEDGGVWAEALTELAAHLPEGLLGEALGVARALPEVHTYSYHDFTCLVHIDFKFPRERALVGLAYRLPLPLLWEALTAAREMGARARVKVLTGLIPHLPEASRGQILEEALKVTRKIEDEGTQAKALKELAPYLPEPLLREALTAARKIGEEGARVDALTGLIPHFPKALSEQILEESLATAWGIGKEVVRAWVLTRLAPHLREALRVQVLEEALTATREIKEDWAQAWMLVELIPYLREGLRREALKVAWKIEDAENRVRVLTQLAPYLAAFPRPALARLWIEERDGANLLRALACRPRRHLLSDLHALAPVIAALGGPEAVTETFRAIQDVGRWWP